MVVLALALSMLSIVLCAFALVLVTRRRPAGPARGARAHHAPRAEARGLISDIGGGPSDEASVVSVLAASTAQQAEAMVRIAELSAQSLRAATGTYVFQLRDRFDEAFPVPQIGVAGSSWDGGPDAPGSIDELVFHQGDSVRAVVSLVCNQAALRRRIRLVVDECPPGVSVGDAVFTSSATSAQHGREYWAPADLSAFVDVPLTMELGALGVVDPSGVVIPGRFEHSVRIRLMVTDTRPEGAVSDVPVTIVLAGLAVPDDDGVGFDLLSADAFIGAEERSYFLDKHARLALTMPLAPIAD
jgi:hypothetical protein